MTKKSKDWRSQRRQTVGATLTSGSQSKIRHFQSAMADPGQWGLATQDRRFDLMSSCGELIQLLLQSFEPSLRALQQCALLLKFLSADQVHLLEGGLEYSFEL